MNDLASWVAISTDGNSSGNACCSAMPLKAYARTAPRQRLSQHEFLRSCRLSVTLSSYTNGSLRRRACDPVTRRARIDGMNFLDAVSPRPTTFTKSRCGSSTDKRNKRLTGTTFVPNRIAEESKMILNDLGT